MLANSKQISQRQRKWHRNVDSRVIIIQEILDAVCVYLGEMWIRQLKLVKNVVIARGMCLWNCT